MSQDQTTTNPTNEPTQNDRLVTESCEIELPLKLSLEEISERAKRIAELETELRDTEEEFKEVKADFKTKLEGIKGKMRRVIETVRTGFEPRPCKAQRCFDFNENRFYILYKGNRYQERDLYPAEYAKGLQPLFPDTANVQISEVEPGQNAPTVEAELVATTDGKVTQLAPKTKRLQPPGPGMTIIPGTDVADLIKEETNRKTKKDHLA